MAYSIIVSPRAQIEIEYAIDYYALNSENAPSKFIFVLQEAYKTLKINPFFSMRYKNVRALKLNKFSYSLYFTIIEEQKIVQVLSCFHNKRNPVTRPKQ